MKLLTNDEIVENLMLCEIINADGKTVNVRFQSKLNKFPELAALIVENTSFLLYSAPLIVRIHCLIDGIKHQPKCQTCGNIVEMRISGRERYSFPSFCSQRCVSTNKTVQTKKRQTVMDRYGVTNVKLIKS